MQLDLFNQPMERPRLYVTVAECLAISDMWKRMAKRKQNKDKTVNKTAQTVANIE